MLLFLCQIFLNHQHSMDPQYDIISIVLISWKYAIKIPWCIKTLAFCPEHPKWYQTLQFPPLSREAEYPRPF